MARTAVAGAKARVGRISRKISSRRALCVDRALCPRALMEVLEPRQLLSSDPGPLVISEFEAKTTKLLDNYGAPSDWIEIHNPTQTTVALDGWYLTDNANNKIKWQFPDPNPGTMDIPLAAGAYLVVFASGTSHTTLGQPFHTGFALSQNPGYLGLIRPDGVTVASEYAPEYPQQASDISYGWTTDGTRKGFFFEPSRGLPNGNDVSGSSAPVIVNEIMYNTARGSAGSIGYVAENTKQEYVELYNRSKSAVSLNGWQLDNWWFSPNPLKAITGITSADGATARATLVAGHDYANGDSVLITGASPSQFNGVFTISNVTATNFDYTIAGVAATSTGNITAQKGVRQVQSILRGDWMATVTLSNHGFANGDTVLISGANQDAYNGAFTIANVTANSFTYMLNELPSTPATGTILAERVSRQLPDVSIAGQGYLVLAADAKAFREKYPLVTNVIGGWTSKMANNGETITLMDNLGETVDKVSYSNEGDWARRTRGEKLVTNISVNGRVVTLTVPYHGYTIADRAEDKVYRIVGVDQAEYNGEFTITAVDARHDHVFAGIRPDGGAHGGANPDPEEVRQSLRLGLVLRGRWRREIIGADQQLDEQQQRRELVGQHDGRRHPRRAQLRSPQRHRPADHGRDAFPDHPAIDRSSKCHGGIR